MTAFDRARLALANSFDSGTSLCDPFMGLFPVDGAAVSLLGERVGQSTVCSSNDTAARLDEIQLDSGDGPCWQAMTTRTTVVAADLRAMPDSSWPGFLDTLRSDPISDEVGSMYALPLTVGSLEIGAIDLFSSSVGVLTRPQLQEATTLARIAAWQVLRRVLSDEVDGALSSGPRREVHQATGMVLAQLNVSAQDAELMLRAHAFATGRTVLDVATDVIERRLDFSGEE